MAEIAQGGEARRDEQTGFSLGRRQGFSAVDLGVERVPRAPHRLAEPEDGLRDVRAIASGRSRHP